MKTLLVAGALVVAGAVGWAVYGSQAKQITAQTLNETATQLQNTAETVSPSR